MKIFVGNCNNLIEFDVSNWNVKNATTFYQMFYHCHALKNINCKNWNAPNVTTMQNMFYACYSVEELDLSNLNILNLLNISLLFSNCRNLTTLILGDNFDCSQVTNARLFISNCGKLTHIIGNFKNLGMSYNTTSANNSSYNFECQQCPLTYESLINVINGLYDIGSKGIPTQRVVLGTENMAKLTTDEIAILTNKGWTVS